MHSLFCISQSYAWGNPHSALGVPAPSPVTFRNLIPSLRTSRDSRFQHFTPSLLDPRPHLHPLHSIYMSDPSSSTAPAQSGKPAKQPKAPKPSAQGGGGGGGGGEAGVKAKSAKELKKEKRAALVSSRGPVDEPRGPPSESPNLKARPGLPPSTNSHTAAASQHTSAPTLRRATTQTSHHHHHHPSSDPAHPPSSQALFFSHIPPHLPPDTAAAFNTSKLHPDIIRLGVMMSSGSLRGANARTMAMMAAFQEVIRDYECPDQADLWKDLPIYLSPMIAWLEGCRPKGVGGGNAIRWLKSEINRLGEGDERTHAEVRVCSRNVRRIADAPQQKAFLVEAIGVYIRDRIEFADQVIADNAKEKILPGETIVTYAR
jgi:translation initiation factor eIF-2B subunit delta